MNKVFTSVIVGLALGAASAVSADVSLGGGVLFGSDFGGGTEFKAKGSYSYQGETGSIDNSNIMKAPYLGGGAYLFFDATYVEVSFGYFYGSGKWKNERAYAYTGSQTGSGGDTTEYDVSFSAINLGYLLKYPIALSDQITFFPAVGIDYQLTVGGEMSYDGKTYDRQTGKEKDTTYTYKWDGKDDFDRDIFSALIFKFGVGFDFALTEQLYLRPELLYGIRLSSYLEKMMNYGGVDSDIEDQLDITGPRTRLGHGLTVKVGVGYKF